MACGFAKAEDVYLVDDAVFLCDCVELLGKALAQRHRAAWLGPSSKIQLGSTSQLMDSFFRTRPPIEFYVWCSARIAT
jgi:hypothetical protein